MRFTPLLLVLAACAPFQPGAGVTPDFAATWGCDAGAVAEGAANVAAALETGSNRYIPRPGWNACQLLTQFGAPQKVDQQFAADGVRAASWWYECPECAGGVVHLVSLEYAPAQNQWVVTYVGW